MKRIISIVMSIVLGFGIGWYFGHTRPVAKNQRKLLKEYQGVRDAFHATDEEMADFGGRLPEFWDAAKRQDEFAAAMALAAHVKLDKNDTNATRRILESIISSYYRGHRQDGDTNVIAHIEHYASTNTTISNAIYGRLE